MKNDIQLLCHFSLLLTPLPNNLLVFYTAFMASSSTREMHVIPTLICFSHILNNRQVCSPVYSTSLFGYPDTLSSPVPKVLILLPLFSNLLLLDSCANG